MIVARGLGRGTHRGAIVGAGLGRRSVSVVYGGRFIVSGRGVRWAVEARGTLASNLGRVTHVTVAPRSSRWHAEQRNNTIRIKSRSTRSRAR